MNDLTLLRLLQITDSGFPTGAFTFSSGVEGIAAAGWATTEAELIDLVGVQIEEGITGIELPALRRAHRAIDDLERLLELDALVSGYKPIAVYRQASVKIGRRLLESAHPLVASTGLSAYRDAVHRGDAAGHHAVAFGVVGAAIGLAEPETALSFGAAFLHGQAAVAVRLGLIGQSAVQRLIGALQPRLVTAVEETEHLEPPNWFAYAPMLDLVGLRHASLDGRLFSS